MTQRAAVRYDPRMEIIWYGHSCFRLRGRDATVITDPCPPSTGYKIGKLPADVVTISHDAPEHNYRQAITGAPKFLSGPGEYDIAGVLVAGVRTRRGKLEEDSGRNVAFVIDIDDIRVCHLGDLKQVPHAEVVEQLGSADILLIPVGGGSTIDARGAAETVSLLEPKIVVPMRYRTANSTSTEVEGLERFLKEMGAEAKTPESRLNITKSQIPADTTVVVLEARG
jgi:L-ascorbate metabolism protein UlaG (beta-lactamase superfamily)